MWRIVHLSLLCAFLAASCSAQTDRTKEKNACSSGVRDATISKFSSNCFFKDDHLLANVFARTSNCQTGTGGMWKVKRSLFESTKTASSLSKQRTEVGTFIDKKWTDIVYEDLDFPMYSYLALKMVMEMNSAPIPRSSAHQVAYLRDVIQSSETYTAERLTAEKNELVTNCKSKKVDMVFVVDASGSVGESSFKTALKFLQDVVDSLTIGAKAARVGMVRYSDKATVMFKLDKYTSKSDIKTAINNVGYTKGNTYTNLGLDLALQMFKNASKLQFKTKQLLILLTDGKSTDGDKAKASAQKVKDANIKLIALGVGNGIDETELNAIASSPKCKYVHLLSNFDVAVDFVNQLSLQTCKAPSIVSPGVVIAGELTAGETFEVQFQVKNEYIVDGFFRVKLTGRTGTVHASVSTDPNPNPDFNYCTLSASDKCNGVCYVPVNTRGSDAGTTALTVYASITGLDHLNIFHLFGAAPRSSQPSLSALVTCLILMITRM